MVVPSICATVWLNCCRAAATLARVVVTASRACESSSCGDGAVRHQSAAALQVLIRGALRLLTLVDLRAQLLALRKQAAHLAHGAGEIRLGIGHGDFRIRRIELEQRLARLHALGVVDVQRQHRARYLARDLHHVAVDVGIVGGFVVAAVEEPVRAVADRAEHDGSAQSQESRAPIAAWEMPWVGIFRGSHWILAYSWDCSCQRNGRNCGMMRVGDGAGRTGGSKLPPTARSSVTRATAWLAKMSTMD